LSESTAPNAAATTSTKPTPISQETIAIAIPIMPKRSAEAAIDCGM